MPIIACTDCGKEISDAAPSCLNCGKPNKPAVSERPVSILLGIGILVIPLIFAWFTLRQGHTTRAKIIAFSWLVLSLIIINSSNGKHSQSTSSLSSNTMLEANAEVKKEEAEAENLTGSQKNAVRSAKQYLSMTGFSRNGLIQQLSSDAGDGYSVTDATVAVDSLNADWNQEAVRSAKQYLNMSGFSCKGLIEQLSSSAGDKYTVKQATYGAQQAGACR